MNSRIRRRRESTGRSRRGGNAVEFALLAPLFCGLVLGAAEYGLFFLQETLVTNGLRQAVRVGGMQTAAETDAAHQCSPCLERAEAMALEQLSSLRIDTAQEGLYVTPTIVNVADTCGLILDATIPYESLVGIVPLPHSFNVRVSSLAQDASGC